MDQISELEAHQRAYLQIFRAILKKKNATPEQAKAVLGKLQQYVAARIKAPDDFLDHIPNFAKGLAVRPEALSAFIGSNLLPALENVKKQMREAAAEAASAPAMGGAPAGNSAVSDAEVADSVLKELEREVGTIVAEQQRFNSEDMGHLRLVSLNGGQDIPGKSLREAMGVSAPPVAEAPAPGAGADGAKIPVTGAASGSGGGSPAAEPGAAQQPAPLSLSEKSIIEEILEQFGEELVVSGPLHVPAFPRSQSETPAQPAAAAAASPAGPAAVGDAAAAGAAGEATPAPAAAPAGEVEPSIIGEILEQFGDDLTVTGPLVMRADGTGQSGAGAVAGGDAGMPGLPAADAGGMGAGEPPPVELPEVPLSFQQFMDVVRKLQEFQSSGDRAAYSQWLTGEAGDGGKAMVGLRNVDARVKRGDDVHWPDEYQKIAGHMMLETGQIESLHRRIARFQKLQQLLNQFIASVKTKEPPLIAAVKKIWPQVRLLFNDEWEAESMMSKLKIPLLQIPDPALKAQVQSLMMPLLKKAESLAKAS
ncbi:MAG: hypothetical protein NXI24_09080 [bacterium]|nr:hypothetical protein [bacterium]